MQRKNLTNRKYRAQLQTMKKWQQYQRQTGDSLSAAMIVLAEAIEESRAVPPNPPALTVQDAAEFLNVPSKSIYNLCRNGSLKHHRIGTGRGTIRIKRADLELFVRTNEVRDRLAF